MNTQWTPTRRAAFPYSRISVIRVLVVLCAALFSAGCKTASAQNVVKAAAPTHAPMVLSSNDSLKAIKLLSSRIDHILGDKGLRGAEIGIAIRSMDADKTLYAKNPSQLLTPASTTKLFSTFAAFYTLGNGYNVPTSVYTDVENVENGVVNGNLYLVGGGDPLLTTADIEQLAEQVRNLGIKKVTGSIYGDASYFDDVTDRYKYSGDKDEVQSVSPISALSLNRNEVTIVITSGATAGERVRVQTIPVSDAFTFVVNATVKGGRKARSNVSVRQSTAANGKQTFTISGTLPPRKTVSYNYIVSNPALVAAGVLYSRLESSGIKIAGKPDVRPAPASKSHVLTAFYRPLGDIAAYVNKHSDNFGAEHIFKMVGGTVHEENKNTAVAARQLMKSSFTKCDIPFQNCTLNDGSGLSRRNLVSPVALVTLLEQAWKLPFGQTFVNSFAVAGVDGTLRRRMKGTRAEGNLIAKTGTLRNVSALAGYVTTLDGEQLAFSLIFNGNSVGVYKQAENAIGALLADFSYLSAFQSVSEQ
jgi:D-alanyl-D-alanine carboxypeptidase/D-alanyl-D-alanine-endopeptidase (penicillin-binding protein 4)